MDFSAPEVVILPVMVKCGTVLPMKWKVLVHLLLITGAQRGEIPGLKWSAVDFDRNQVHICNSILYASDRGIYEDTPMSAEARCTRTT